MQDSRNTVLDDRVHIQVTDDLTSSEKRHEVLPGRLGDGRRRGIRTLWSAGSPKGAAQSTLYIVVDDCSGGSGGPCKSRLQAKVAGPARYECNGATDFCRVIGLNNKCLVSIEVEVKEMYTWVLQGLSELQLTALQPKFETATNAALACPLGA
jgi:hypothetical protein